MAKGDFVRWTAVDESGEFSYVGQVIADSKTGLFMQTAEGEMYVPKDDGVITAARKPKGWAGKTVAVATAPKAEKKVAAPKAERKAPAATKGPRKGSRVAEAVAVLSEVDRGALNRQQMIAILKEKLGIEDHKKASGLYQAAIKKVA